MKDSLAIIASIVYWDDLDYNKYFYWDGAQLQKVSKDKIVSIFNNIWEAGYINFPFNTPKNMQL